MESSHMCNAYRNHAQLFGFYNICKLEWFTFESILGFLKMHFLHCKNVNQGHLTMYSKGIPSIYLRFIYSSQMAFPL
jgi:hypothetical protein